MAATLLTAGIATALYARERTGRGQRVDVSLLQAALVLQNNTAHHVDAIASGRPEFVKYLHEAYADGSGWPEILEQRQRRPYIVPRGYYGFFTRYEYEILGGVSVVGPPLLLSETPLASQGAPPVLGKHTRELLARGGLDSKTIEALIADGAAVAYD